MNVPADASTSPSRVGHDRTPQAEEMRVHTRLQRLALGVEESRAYWAHVEPATPTAARAIAAFEGRWFGAKSLERIRVLLPYLAARYDAFPNALDALRRWKSMAPDTRRVICHWHLQLTDPIYRRFSGEFLPARRASPGATLDRAAVLRWVRATFPGRWGESTLIQFASKLLSAGAEAGTLSAAPDPRRLPLPNVPDEALDFLKEHLEPILEGPDGIAGDIARALDAFVKDASVVQDRSVVFLSRVTALYPFVRASALLKHIAGRTHHVPVILLYPGAAHDRGLSFLGELTADRDYRPRLYP